MARRPKTAGPDPFADLAKKMEVLEQELAVQRAALDKLKDLGAARRVSHDEPLARVRKSA